MSAWFVGFVKPVHKTSALPELQSRKRLARISTIHVKSQRAMLNWRFAIYNKLGAMKPDFRSVIKAACWAGVLVAGWFFLRDWFAPDACMDFGGAFDYVHWRCSHDSTEHLSYIDVPAYKLPSFQLLLGAVLVAVVVQVVLRAPRHGA